MQGTVMEAWQAREVKEAAPGRSRPPKELHSVLKGKQAPARWTGRGNATCPSTEHEAKCAPKSDWENMVNDVRCTFPQSYQPELPWSLQTPVTLINSWGFLAVITQWVLELSALCCRCVSCLFKEIVSHLRAEAVYSIFSSSEPRSMPFLWILSKQQTFVAGGIYMDGGSGVATLNTRVMWCHIHWVGDNNNNVLICTLSHFILMVTLRGWYN